MLINNATLTGSLTINNTSFNVTNGVMAGTASVAVSSSYAATASYASAFTVGGTLTAQTLVVQTVSSSVIYSSGSNVFGNNIANTQVMTGSVTITGSLAVVTNGTEFQVTNTGVKFGNVSTDVHPITGSVNVSGSAAFTSTVTTLASTTNGFIAQTTANSVYPYFRWVANNRSYWAAAIDNGADAPFSIGNGNTVGSSILFTLTPSNNSATFSGDVTISNKLSVGGLTPSNVIDAYGGSAGSSARIKLLHATSGASIQLYTGVSDGQGIIAGAFPFWFDINGTERGRFTSGGYFKASVNGTYQSSTGLFHELRQTANNDAACITTHTNTSPYGHEIIFSSSPDNNTNYFLLCKDGTANRTIIYSDGDVWTSDAGTLTSDISLKTNITDATSKLDDLMKLKVRNFNWNEDYHPNKKDKKLIGFIAQEFEEVFPSMVTEHKIKQEVKDEEGNIIQEAVYKKGIKEGKLIPMLVKAIQELQAQITELKNK
jgi:hypothetical protein